MQTVYIDVSNRGAIRLGEKIFAGTPEIAFKVMTMELTRLQERMCDVCKR